MTQEERDLLMYLLNKADENSVLHIYDNKGNIYEVDWIFLDDAICIKIKPF